MALANLKIKDFRRYESTEINLDHRINIIFGSNASGKTTILEAIAILATGRSFRSVKTDNLIRYGSEKFYVDGGVLSEVCAHITKISVSGGKGGKSFSLNNHQPARISELARYLPLVVMSPDSHFDFVNQVRARRAVLDWALFHVEPSFHDTWIRYHRVLHQRNAALKDRRHRDSIFCWDEELSTLGEKLAAFRQIQCHELNRHFEKISNNLLDNVAGVELVHTAGWDRSKSLAENLLNDRERDLQRGTTHRGPHADNLEIGRNGHSIAQEASHGQNKLFFIALRLAQISYIYESTQKACLTLIDDLPAELDTQHRAKLANYLATLPVQVVVTATEPSLVNTVSWPSCKTFHVEQGRITSY